eukprot:s1763_g1.t5
MVWLCGKLGETVDFVRIFVPSMTDSAAVVQAKRFCCSVTAGLVAGFITNPTETIRVRWQVLSMTNPSAADTGLLQFARQILRTEGLIRGLWLPGCAGWMASFGGAFGVRMGIYESVRCGVESATGLTRSPKTAFMAGLCTGSVANAVCCPFFQAKNRLQAQCGSAALERRSLPQELMAITRESGLTGLYRGVPALFMRGGLIAGGQLFGYDTLVGLGYHAAGTSLQEVVDQAISGATGRAGGPGGARLLLQRLGRHRRHGFGASRCSAEPLPGRSQPWQALLVPLRRGLRAREGRRAAGFLQGSRPECREVLAAFPLQHAPFRAAASVGRPRLSKLKGRPCFEPSQSCFKAWPVCRRRLEVEAMLSLRSVSKQGRQAARRFGSAAKTLQELWAGGAPLTQVVSESHSRAAKADRNEWVYLAPVEQVTAEAARLQEKASSLSEEQRKLELPLLGSTVAVKDNLQVKGMPITNTMDYRPPRKAPIAEESAAVVRKLQERGAIVIGKTNMDCAATGLVGVRSPYGACQNSLDRSMISGGSSSGSGVSVALGQVTFSLGTDTAGSGRVPAALNNIVGLKASRGLVSTHGLLPACRSLDCVSIFALTVHEAHRILGVAADASGADPFDRPAKELRHGRRLAPGEAFTFGIPSRQFLDFHSFGSAAQARAKEYAAAWDRSVEALQAIGGTCVEVDYAPFQEAANLLYQGPWVAERLAAIAAVLQEDPEVIEPTVRKIVEQGHQYTAQQCFEASYRMRALHRAAEASMEAAKAQVLVTPTVGATYKIEDVLADPIALNTNLGRYTNHMNLLDLCGLAVPTMWAGEALPFGVTISAQAGSDAYICDIGQRLHASSGLPVGAMEAAVEDVEAAVAAKMGSFYGPLPSGVDTFEVAVCGAHMAGLPLSPQLTERGGRFMRAARTSPRYRLVAFDEMKPPRPGLVDAADGASIDLEIWELPASSFGSFMKLVASPLGIGWIELEDGSRVQGFRQVDASVNRGGQVGVGGEPPADITSYGSWRSPPGAARVEVDWDEICGEEATHKRLPPIGHAAPRAHVKAEALPGWKWIGTKFVVKKQPLWNKAVQFASTHASGLLQTEGGLRQGSTFVPQRPREEAAIEDYINTKMSGPLPIGTAFLVVTGSQGIGKSTMLRRAFSKLWKRGWWRGLHKCAVVIYLQLTTKERADEFSYNECDTIASTLGAFARRLTYDNALCKFIVKVSVSLIADKIQDKFNMSRLLVVRPLPFAEFVKVMKTDKLLSELFRDLALLLENVAVAGLKGLKGAAAVRITLSLAELLPVLLPAVSCSRLTWRAAVKPCSLKFASFRPWLRDDVMLVLAALLAQVMTGAAQQMQQIAVDCENEPDNMYCCELEPAEPEGCFLAGFDRNRFPCSPACQKRYQTLGYYCYNKHKGHFWWVNQETQCDPTGIVVFQPDTTSSRPDYRGAVATADAAPLSLTPWPDPENSLF